MLIEIKQKYIGFKPGQVFRAVERDILSAYYIIKKNGKEIRVLKDKCKIIYPLKKVAEEYETAENILECLIESWNDSNPESRMNDDLINLIKSHLRYAYVAGWDDFRIKIEKLIEFASDDRNSQISKYYLEAQIKTFCNGKEVF